MSGDGTERSKAMQQKFLVDDVVVEKSPERDAAYWVCRRLYNACSCGRGSKKPCSRMTDIVDEVKRRCG